MMNELADLILMNGRITTLTGLAVSQANASALAIRNERFIAVGETAEVMRWRGPNTSVIDLEGRRVVPGLIDSHTHVIRGGLNYNMELRWDGLPSLALALRSLRKEVARTPAPQWVRVIGGFSEFQFVEKRLPTLDELNSIGGDTPIFVLHLYDRALLNGAALRALGYTKDTPDPPAGRIERDRHGNPTGLLIAKPNAMLLYSALARGPKLGPGDQRNSTSRFMRELNRLGLTSVVDAGGGYQNYPDDYRVIEELARSGELSLRIAYNYSRSSPSTSSTTSDVGLGSSHPARATRCFASTEPARCWCSRPPISRTSASRVRTCRRRWRPSSKRWSSTWSRRVGRFDCTRPTTNRSAVSSTPSSG
jgi:predicted amidohydrolase YtcJ